jgi:hypothetical protein
MGGTTDNSSSPSFSVSAAAYNNRIVIVDTYETFDGRIFFFDAGETVINGIVFVHACGLISWILFLRVIYR